MTAAHQRRAVWKWTAMAAAWAVLLAIVAAAWIAGAQLRHWTWETTANIHYVPDMRNAYRWGSAAVDEGYLEVYENVMAARQDGQYVLDYAPLRLRVMQQWVRWTRERHPEQSQWTAEYDFNRPLLMFNTGMELAAAVLAGLLVRLWVRRAEAAHAPPALLSEAESGNRLVPPDRATWLGLIAALLVWFNPAMIISAHGRPTWDVWVVPFYLGTVLLGSVNWWFMAGLTLAVGSMFKGQQMLVLGAMVLWPVFAGRWIGALRLAGGFAAGLALVTLPWLVSYRVQVDDAIVRVIDWWAIAWLLVLAVLPVGLVKIRKRWPQLPWYLSASVILLGVTLVSLPFLAVQAMTWVLVGLGFASAVVALAWLGRWRLVPYLSATSVALGALACIWLFHGSAAWWEVPIRYGADKMPQLETGGAFSMAAILQNVYRWRSESVVFTLPERWLVGLVEHPIDVTMKSLLAGLFAVTLVLSAAGMAMHDRRRDARFLAAIVAPWVCYFAIAPLMHERYLLWGAAVAAVCVGTNWGLTLLGILLSLLSWCMSMRQMLNSRGALGGEWWPGLEHDLRTWLEPMYPHAGWAALLAACVFLYMALSPSVPGRRRRELDDDIATAPGPMAEADGADILVDTPADERAASVAGSVAM